MPRYLETPAHLQKPKAVVVETDAEYQKRLARDERYERMLKHNGLYVCTYCKKVVSGRIDGLCEACKLADDSDTAAGKERARRQAESTAIQQEQKNGIF